MPKATFYLWFEIPKRFKNSKEYCDLLLEKSGIVAVPGSAFTAIEDPTDKFVRFSIVASDNELDEVTRRMKEDGHYYSI